MDPGKNSRGWFGPRIRFSLGNLGKPQGGKFSIRDAGTLLPRGIPVHSAGTQSGAGKTNLSPLGLMAAPVPAGPWRWARSKVGPDFFDPGHHSGRPGPWTGRNLRWAGILKGLNNRGDLGFWATPIYGGNSGKYPPGVPTGGAERGILLTDTRVHRGHEDERPGSTRAPNLGPMGLRASTGTRGSKPGPIARKRGALVPGVWPL